MMVVWTEKFRNLMNWNRLTDQFDQFFRWFYREARKSTEHMKIDSILKQNSKQKRSNIKKKLINQSGI
jgi:hypothetical protein